MELSVKGYFPGGTHGLPSATIVLKELAVFPGGTHGFPSANAGTVKFNTNREAVTNSRVFFTVKLLVEVEEPP
jgi:hypothetical protein